MYKFNVLFIFILVTAILSGCVSGKKLESVERPPYFKQEYQSAKKNTTDSSKTSDSGYSVNNSEKGDNSSSQIIKIPNFLEKENVAISLDSADVEHKKEVKLPTGDIQFSVQEMPVNAFINFVFSKILDVSYTISPEVQQMDKKVTLNMTESMKPDVFLNYIIDFMKGFQVDIELDNNIFKISKLDENKRIQGYSKNIYVGRTMPELSGSETITSIIPVYYLDTAQYINFFYQFIDDRSQISIRNFYDSQGIVITGKYRDIKSILNLIKSFDKPFLMEKEAYFLQMDYINVNDFETDVVNILKNMGIPFTKNVQSNNMSYVVLEKKNAMLVFSPKDSWVQTLKYWKNKLDTPDSLSDEKHVFVYRAKNRPAEELLDILKSVSGTLKASAATPEGGGEEEVGTEGQKTISVGSKGFSEFNAVLDKERNSIILTMLPDDYPKMKNLLMKLDTEPKQVLIEVTIAELTLTDQLQYGLEWYLKHSGDWSGELQTMGGLGVGGSGFVYSLTKSNGKFQSILNMFAKDNLIDIVSTPQILVLDGKDATINVGTEVPIVTSETSASDIADTNDGPSILRNVQYRNTGVVLNVTPVVTSNDMLTVELSQELSEAQANNVSQIDSPLILNRSIQTTLNLKSGSTVLLGGLISSNKSDTVSKIPFLGDIPVLGYLFKTTSKGVTKTELVVQITPYIIENTNEIEYITNEFMKNTNFSDSFN